MDIKTTSTYTYLVRHKAYRIRFPWRSISEALTADCGHKPSTHFGHFVVLTKGSTLRLTARTHTSAMC
jgi:hypothetical protein